MISATDSFIQYLASNLAGAPPVAWIRQTATDPTSNDMKIDTLNVTVLGFQEEGSMERPLVSLDIIATDQRQAFVWAKAIRDLLNSQQYTPELDYAANPAAPVATGRSVFWDRDDINFHVVRNAPRTVHLNATFQLSHARQ
jgi:hypothetical protein